MFLSPEDIEFKRRASEWLSSNIPVEPRPSEGRAMREYDLAWIKRQWEGGWSGIAWPKDVGGQDASPLRQILWYEACAEVGAPPVGVGMVGLNFGGPVIQAFGSQQQRKSYLPSILRGEKVWCQGFSEPGAGSDLASIATKGVLCDDCIEVTGQKIWTSYANLADLQLLLIRTDREARKHSGLTMVICEMGAKGVDIRPIRLMSGETNFCEVFYDRVKIPYENVIGEVGQGWSIAISTLGFERGAAFIADQIALERKLETLVCLAKQSAWPSADAAIKDGEINRQLSRLRARISGMKAFIYMQIGRRDHEAPPGPEGSMMKLYYSTVTQALHRLAFELIGDKAIAFEYGDTGWVRDYFYSFAASIGGGTSEIQREIIADRVLRLPRLRGA